jgi:hypothetical protein
MRKMMMATCAALVVAVPAFADDWDFVLINSSGKSIKTIELAPTGTTTWQANKVDPDFKKEGAVIKSGARTTVHFDKGSTCKYDVKATFEDDSNAVWSAINICDNSFVTVKYSAAGAPVFTAN